MTTIATDGRSMAGDGMVTENDHICRTDFKKVRRLSDGRIVGFCGNGYNWEPFVEWLESNGESDLPKMEEGIGALVLYPDGSIRQYDEHGRWFPEVGPVAIGSGTRFALAAMDFGKSPADAVRYAAKRDIYTGGDISVIVIDTPIRAVA